MMFRFFIKPVMTFAVIAGIIVFDSCENKSSKSAKQNTSNIDKPITQLKTVDVQTFRDAALNGQLEKVMTMIPEMTNIDSPDESGHTALMLAAYNGHMEIVRQLLDKGASVNLLDMEGRTALLYASTGAFPETVTLLLRRGAKLDIVDNGEHFTALMFAAAEGHLNVVKVLMTHGADASLEDIDGDTAASFARKNGHNEVADYITNFK